MTNKVQVKSISDLFQDAEQLSDVEKLIACYDIDENNVATQLSSPIYLNAFIIVLVLSGSGTIRINYKPYDIREETIMLLSSSHLFNFIYCTPDFRCSCILVSKDFMEEMDATDMIYRRIKYGARLYSTPIVKLNAASSFLLKNRITAIDGAIENVGHFYHKEMILNSLFAFYLDLSNIIEKDTDSHSSSNLTRYESIIGSFIELLVANYRKEHKVDFYASLLNITPHYLTLIVKRITGQTVNDFIFEMLYSEARNLLTHSKLSIQEIASLLHFSDQSSFGKFFKRRYGMSPVEFRKRM